MQLLSFLNNRNTVTANISLARQGDKDAFLSLITENQLNMYRVAKGMLNEEHDIEDAIQNTIINAYTHINTIRNEEYFRTWLLKILINECNMILRNKKRTVSMEERTEGEHSDNYKDLDLTRAVNSLSKDIKLVTILFYFNDMPIKEISKTLKIPEGTVKSRLTRARKELYEILGED